MDPLRERGDSGCTLTGPGRGASRSTSDDRVTHGATFIASAAQMDSGSAFESVGNFTVATYRNQMDAVEETRRADFGN